MLICKALDDVEAAAVSKFGRKPKADDMAGFAFPYRAFVDRETEKALDALARRLGVAYSHFRRAFKQHTGYAPWQYVLSLRLAHARRALASTDCTLDEIAARLGFSSAFHFSAAFKRACGVAPSDWRRQLANQPERAATEA